MYYLHVFSLRKLLILLLYHYIIINVLFCTQTNVFIKRAFINILSTVSTGVVGRTITGIRIYSVNTAPSILAKMFTIDVAIVDVYLALISSETFKINEKPFYAEFLVTFQFLHFHLHRSPMKIFVPSLSKACFDKFIRAGLLEGLKIQ